MSHVILLYFIHHRDHHGFVIDNVVTCVAVTVVISSFCNIQRTHDVLVFTQYTNRTNSILSINVPPNDNMASHGADELRNGTTG